MEFDSFFGVPAHPLAVHIPVVCVPLAAIGAVALALRPGWRRAYGPLVIVLAAVGAVGAQLATGSGESLEETRRVRDLGDHPELGELARTVAFVLLALVVALYAIDRWRAHPRLRRVPAWVLPALAVLTVAGAAGATASIVAAGHTGAKAVWEDRDARVARAGP
jgi:uncharacterized membrane protein YsdA (DUF1294 family)